MNGGNPELRRNLWLELSPQRLWGMPLVLGAIFLLAFAMDERRFAGGVATTAEFLVVALAFFWGVRLASEAVVVEIRERTWDCQRMSVIGPWAMTWGKLFGSTVFPWYGTIICLAVYALASPDADAGKRIVLYAASALLGQATGLLASLVALRKDRKFNRSQAAAFFVIGLVVALPLLSALEGKPVSWFGREFLLLDFALFSVLLFAGWALAGIYRLMRLELQLKNRPWTWLAFVFFLMVYAAGFSVPRTASAAAASWASPLWTAYVVAVTVAYFTMLAEPKDPVHFHRLMAAWRGKRWRSLAEALPCWLVTLPAVVLGFLCLFLFPPFVAYPPLNVRLFLLSSLAFLGRDLALVLFFNLGSRRKNPDMLAVLWLALLYGVIPALFAVLKLEQLTHLFWPRVDLHPVVSLLAGIGEMLVVVHLVRQRWETGTSTQAAPSRDTA